MSSLWTMSDPLHTQRGRTAGPILTPAHSTMDLEPLAPMSHSHYKLAHLNFFFTDSKSYEADY